MLLRCKSLKYWLSSLVMAVALMATSTTAAADPLDMVRQANSHYDGGDFRTALKLYRQAYDELGDARLLYRIGLSYENIGNYARGREFLERYLEEDPDSPVRGRVEATIGQLTELERAIQAYLLIETEPAGAEVYLHGYLGQPEGVSPAKIPVGAGQNRVTLAFPQGQRLEVDVEVGAGSTEERFFTVGTASAPPVDESDEIAAAEVGTPSEPSEVVDHAVDEASETVEDDGRRAELEDDVIPSPEASPERRQQIRLDYVDAGPPWWATTLAVVGIVGGHLLIGRALYVEMAGDLGPAPWASSLIFGSVGIFGGIYLLGRNWRGSLPTMERAASGVDRASRPIPAATVDWGLGWSVEF